MANLPDKPTIYTIPWINGQTKLNSANLTSGVNNNLTNLKTAVDGIIDSFGDYLPLSGGTLTGNLNLGAHTIYGANAITVKIGNNQIPLAGKMFNQNAVYFGSHSAPTTILSSEARPRFDTNGDYLALVSDTVVLVEITWAALKTLRDGGNLVPGRQYRIMDYQCTTTTENTSSAEHQFDIIVIADNANTLNENARACLHDGDAYFSKEEVSAWQLKYCLDNDTNRFAWADSTNGKGVIYRMIDDVGNDCPYDFKNILFSQPQNISFTHPGPGYQLMTRYPDLDSGGYYCWKSQYFTYFTASANPSVGDPLYINTAGTPSGYYVETASSGYTSRYTFFSENLSDASISSFSSTGGRCHENILANYSSINSSTTLLPFNVFMGTHGSPAYQNVFGENCHLNTFLSQCHSNVFGRDCYGNNCSGPIYSNLIGNGFSNNTIRGSFYSNVIGNDFRSNISSTSFEGNSIGNNFLNNTMDYAFQTNTIGNSCYTCSFGQNFRESRIGDYVNHLVFGSGFYGISIGNWCSYITFGDSSSTINSCKKIIIDNGCSYLYINSADPASTDSNPLQNVHVHLGVTGSSSSNRLTLTVPDRALAYETEFAKNGSTKIVVE